MTTVFILMACLGGDAYTDAFAQGNAAYAEGNLKGAITSYNRLVDSGVVNAPLYYNLGNACYHLGDLGGAILNYERAVGLDPHLDPARQALALAVEETNHQLPRPEGFAMNGNGPSWIPGIPRRHFRWALVGLWCVLWGILAARLWKARRLRSKVDALAGVFLVLCAFSLWAPRPQPQAAVVLAPSSPARYGPHPGDAARWLLGAGDRVLVDRAVPGWMRVETADGSRGWVDDRDLALVGPPFHALPTEREPSSK